MIGIAAILAHPMPLAAVTAIFGWWLFLLAALDLEHEWLPDRLTWPLLAAGLAAAWGGFGPPLDEPADRRGGGLRLPVPDRLALSDAARPRGAGRRRSQAVRGDRRLARLDAAAVRAGRRGAARPRRPALKRLRGEAVAATDRLPLGTLMALAAWPIWIVISR